MRYAQDRVADLVPGIWDEGRVLDRPNPHAPDPDMPKSTYVDPHRSSDPWAELADVQRAWRRAPLTLAQRQALLLRYGLDFKMAEGGAQLGITKQSFQERAEGGLSTLTNYLNGDL